VEKSRWYGFVRGVMRRPGLSIFGGCAVLVLLALPVTQATLEVPHEEVLPAASPSRTASVLLEQHFGELVVAPVVVVLETDDPSTAEGLRKQIALLPHVRNVRNAGTAEGGTLLHVTGDRMIARGGAAARDVVREIERLGRGGETPLRVGGVAAGEREFLDAMRHGIPRVLLLVLSTTFLVLAVGFRSLTLPLKAIVLDSLSIFAAFGAVLLVFEHGIGAGLLGVEPLGYADATLPLILFCMLFGLSMDYEVFMLARVTELYQAGHDHEDATARGVAGTAPLVTGAALILIVIGAAFAMTELVLIRELGMGMATALALDATIVRFILLPATMQLLGARNWWMPRWLLLRVPRLEWSH